MNDSSTKERFNFDAQWSPLLRDAKITQISTYFLEHYHHLPPYGLTHGEAMFVVHLMKFKWGAKPPSPSYGLLAQSMGVTRKSIQRLVTSLTEKGYLRCTRKYDLERFSQKVNHFYLEPLVEKLVALKTGAISPLPDTPRNPKKKKKKKA